LTIHKSQGITESNGVIVSFAGTRMPRAVSRMGLAFVAWTRSTCWKRTAFLALPPMQEFLAVRLSREFRSRCAFEVWADELHDALLLSRGIVEVDHIAEHKKDLQKKLLVEEHREATALELADIEQMLCLRGVAPVSDSVMALGTQKPGQSSGGGLWSIVSTLRADKKAGAPVAARKGQRH